MPKSYKGEVLADNSGQWCGNALRFATEHDALAYITDLSRRWTAVREFRVVESEDQVNYSWVDGKAQHIEEKVS